MIRKTKKTRKYSAPSSKEMNMALEKNFCATLDFNIQVQEWKNMNDVTDPDDLDEAFYFES